MLLGVSQALIALKIVFILLDLIASMLSKGQADKKVLTIFKFKYLDDLEVACFAEFHLTCVKI